MKNFTLLSAIVLVLSMASCDNETVAPQPDVASMSAEQAARCSVFTTTYQGKKIKIVNHQGVEKLFIENRLMNAAKDPASGRYLTPLLPFDDYATMLDLAKDLIDLGLTS